MIIFALITSLLGVYPNNLKIWHSDYAKAPGFNDRNRVNITNMDPIAIVESRELSRGLNAKFSDYLGIIVSIPQTVSKSVEETETRDVFQQLPLEEWEQDYIYSIISTMGEKNLLQLGFEKKTLKKRGKKINHVHPLRFAGYIFADPYLKKCMSEVKKSSFKWNGFMRGFAKRMKEEHEKGNLIVHLPGFAKIVNADPEELQAYADKQDWEGLVDALL